MFTFAMVTRSATATPVCETETRVESDELQTSLSALEIGCQVGMNWSDSPMVVKLAIAGAIDIVGVMGPVTGSPGPPVRSDADEPQAVNQSVSIRVWRMRPPSVGASFIP
jgi:hypothetical protein